MMKEDGTYELQGYCIDMIAQLSTKMGFEYDLILPTDGKDFGFK